jgi:hypothetical protein
MQERDGSCQAEERLHTKHGTTRAKRDATCQECDAAQRRVGYLKVELEREKAKKLDAENASAGLTVDLGQEKAKALALDKELAEARKNLEVEASEHDMLCATIGVVCDDLRVAQTEGTSSLAAHVVDITAQVGA